MAAPRGGDPKAIGKFTPRRSDRLPAALAAAGQRQDLRGLRPPAERNPAAARGALRQLGARRPSPKGVKNFAAPAPRPTSPKILLVNRPGSPQSTHPRRRAAAARPARATSSPFDTANEVLGGDFLSRLNMDLREDQGLVLRRQRRRLGAASMRCLTRSPRRCRPTTPAIRWPRSRADRRVPDDQGRDRRGAEADGRERRQPAAGPVRNVGRGARRDDEHGRARPARRLLRDAGAPSIARRPRPSLDQAARAALDPKGFVWIVVGDAAKVRPQLEKLGMPIEVVRRAP